jgi:hypothetical protein
MNKKQQGDIGVAKAIYYYTALGMIVSAPLTDNAKYDLIVDNKNKINRIQIKTSSYKVKSGSYEVQLKTTGGNQSWQGSVSKIDAENADVLFVVCDDGSMYEFPPEVFDKRTTITLGKEYEKFRVGLDRW